MKEKIFIGSTKVIENNWGEFTAISFSKDDKALLDAYSNERGYSTINIFTNPQGLKYACINPYGAVNPPQVQPTTRKASPAKVEQKNDINLEEIPF